MINNLYFHLFINLFAGSFLTAVLCYLLDFCFKPGNIFQGYKLMLSRWILNRHVPDWKTKLRSGITGPTKDESGLDANADGNADKVNDLIDVKQLAEAKHKAKVAQMDEFLIQKSLNELIVKVASDYAYWEKPLGMCMICMNIWIALGTIWLTELPRIVYDHWYLAWLFIAYPTLSNYFFRKMNGE